MELNEFESQTREAIDRALNQLQTATLLIAQLETQISDAGRAVQGLSQLIETFTTEHRQSTDTEHEP